MVNAFFHGITTYVETTRPTSLDAATAMSCLYDNNTTSPLTYDKVALACMQAIGLTNIIDARSKIKLRKLLALLDDLPNIEKHIGNDYKLKTYSARSLIDSAPAMNALFTTESDISNMLNSLISTEGFFSLLDDTGMTESYTKADSDTVRLACGLVAIAKKNLNRK